MEVFPLTNIDPAPEGACVISEQVGTVDDMPANAAYIRSLIEKRAHQELEDMRPRFSVPVVSDDQRQPEPSPLAGIIQEAPTRSVTIPAAYTFAVVDKGRIALRDAARVLGWNDATPLAFSVTSSGITVTVCVTDEENGTMLDKQQRCAVPLQARRRKGMKDGDTVLVMTLQTPVAHVRIVTETHLFDALNTKESER